jgi:hypothetical protein
MIERFEDGENEAVAALVVLDASEDRVTIIAI